MSTNPAKAAQSLQENTLSRACRVVVARARALGAHVYLRQPRPLSPYGPWGVAFVSGSLPRLSGCYVISEMLGTPEAWWPRGQITCNGQVERRHVVESVRRRDLSSF
jgi:hypothetical protein